MVREIQVYLIDSADSRKSYYGHSMLYSMWYHKSIQL
jgi:hypothetical protein